MRMKRALECSIVVLAYCALAAPVASASSIPPSSLVPTPLSMPGFGFAETKLQVEVSPAKFSKTILADEPSEVRRETTLLKRNGFREGVGQVLSTPTASGQDIAAVFGSTRGAQREFKRALAEAPSAIKPEARFSDAAIPNAQGFTATGETKASATQPAEPSRFASLLFSSGHCLFIVNVVLDGTSTAEQAEQAPLAGANTLYTRVKTLCAR
jgi:hypothetical protein